MVVSEMGEQWSPHTAPAMQAETHMTPMGSVMGNTSSVMGISKYAEGTPAGTRSEAEEAADKEYYGRQEGLEALGRTLYGRSYVCASAEGIGHCLEGPGAVSISIAGTMALKPSGSMPIISEKLISLRS